MAAEIGITSLYRHTASQTITGTVALASITGFSGIPIAANQTAFLEISSFGFTLGATGGFRFNWVFTTAVPSSNTALYRVNEFTTPASFGDLQTTLADFTNASAVAAEYSLYASLYVVNGATAGTIAFQAAQNNAQATNFVIPPGALLRVTVFN